MAGDIINQPIFCARFVYFNKDSYDGCICKWHGDTVEFRLPFDIFGISGGDELKDIRVFLQDSAIEWKLMGNITASNVAVPDTEAHFIVSKPLLGDANLDGKVTVADAVALLQYIANKDKYPLAAEARSSADVYARGDGITASDALTIQRVDSGLISLSDLPLIPQ